MKLAFDYTRKLANLYPVIYKAWPDLKFQMIPFENTPKNASEILQNLGQDIDIVGGVFDAVLLKYRKCNGLELYRERGGCIITPPP